MGAPYTLLVVNTPAAAQRTSALMMARSSLPGLCRMPAWTPDAENPLGAHTPPGTTLNSLISHSPFPLLQRQSLALVKAQHHVHALHRRAAAALAQIVQQADEQHPLPVRADRGI